jgi:hypothetical protein
MTPDIRRDDDGPLDAVSALREDVPPPALLERRIVRGLRARGLLRPARAWPRVAAAAAALVLTFAAGWLAGRGTGDAETPAPGTQYVLFLHGESGGAEGDRVREYGAWAREARARGRRLTGERLEPGATVLGGEGDAAAGVTGYFVFTAESDADALAVARSHPHLAHGGRVVLRRIAPS